MAEREEPQDEEDKGRKRGLPTGRLGRLARMGKLAMSLAGDVAGAAVGYAVGGEKDEVGERFHRAVANQLAVALGGMKGLPMKVGQMLSYIDDFIPPPYRPIYGEILRTLQVKSSPLAWSQIEETIRRDLGAAPADLFARFDREPIAAASIGQVYRAALHDGTEVAVKVQYPGIADAIRSDLKNIDVLKGALSLILPKVDIERSLADITSRVLEECDYGCELCNQQDFARAWEGDPEVRIPRAFAERSGDHVLVTEYVTGMGFSEMLARSSPEERSRFARTMFRFVFRSLYVHGLFNADPHPGNYLFHVDGAAGGGDGGGAGDERGCVTFLDFGCVQRFNRTAVDGFRLVRHLVMEGVGGAPLREAMHQGYGIPMELDDEQWGFLEEYVRCCFEPAIVDRPFRFDRAYTQKLLDLSVKGTLIGAKKVVSTGIWEAKQPGLIFLNRLQYGFASILSAMEAEANWFELVAEIDEEMAARTAAAAAPRAQG